MEPKPISEELKKFRKKYSLTRKALAELLGVRLISVYRWEKGLRRPSKTVEILLKKLEEELKKKGGKKDG